MKRVTIHKEQLVPLKRIEGQIRGIQRMIKEERYCVDILIQLGSIKAAISRVEEEIFRAHLEGCVASALKGKSSKERAKKIEEILDLIARFRRK